MTTTTSKRVITLGLVGLLAGSLCPPWVQAGKVASGEHSPVPVAGRIHLTDAQLTGTVHEASRLEILREIALQGAFALELSEALGNQLAQEWVSVTFHQLPLEEGLMRLLPHQSFALGQTPTLPDNGVGSAPPSRTLWIVSREDGGTLGPDGHPGGNVSWSPAPITEYDPEARQVAMFTEALTSEDATQREEAVQGLGDTEHPDAVGPLTEALADEDRDVREEAIQALAEIGGAESAQALGVVLHDQDTSLRVDAIQALKDIGGEPAAQTLAIALQDQDEDIRKKAVKALGDIQGETATRLLTQALADPDKSVRRHAAHGLNGREGVDD